MINKYIKRVILFNSRDELLRMEVEKNVYFEANGNYTNVVTMKKWKPHLGANLSQTEQILTLQMGEDAKMIMRVGKKFIVNLDYIYSVNMAKQFLILSDMEHFAN